MYFAATISIVTRLDRASSTAMKLEYATKVHFRQRAVLVNAPVVYYADWLRRNPRHRFTYPLGL